MSEIITIAKLFSSTIIVSYVLLAVSIHPNLMLRNLPIINLAWSISGNYLNVTYKNLKTSNSVN